MKYNIEYLVVRVLMYLYLLLLCSTHIRDPSHMVFPAAFAGVPLHPRMLAAVRSIGAHSPTPIQSSAMLRVFCGESLAIHSQTGSGKTLAYMLPLLARLREWPPRQVLVVVPTHTLALQIFEVGRELIARASARGTGGAAAVGSIGMLKPSNNTAKKLLSNENAMVVTTVGQFTKLLPALEEPCSTLAHDLRATLQAIVIDELDIVLEPRCSVLRTAQLSRAQRQRYLRKLPLTRVLQSLVPRYLCPVLCMVGRSKTAVLS